MLRNCSSLGMLTEFIIKANIKEIREHDEKLQTEYREQNACRLLKKKGTTYVISISCDVNFFLF